MKPAAQVEAEAADWLARRDAGLGPGDAAALDHWMAASTAHRVAFLRLQAVWAKSDRLRALAPEDLADAPEPQDRLPQVRPRLARFGWIGGGIATAVAAASAFVILIGSGEDYATPVGGFQRLPLADGSQIEMNTDSAIQVAYGNGRRRIELDRGEAFFKVAKDANRPFVVEAGDYRVTAVGTAFSVRLEGERVAVLVTEGRVRVERDGAARPMLLSAGHKAEIGPRPPVVKAVAAGDYGAQLGWREGVLIFDDRPLREVAAEFNRYNREQLVLEDRRVGEVKVGGTFRPTNVAGLTRLLEPGFGVEAVPKGDGRILLRFARKAG